MRSAFFYDAAYRGSGQDIVTRKQALLRRLQDGMLPGVSFSRSISSSVGSQCVPHPSSARGSSSTSEAVVNDDVQSSNQTPRERDADPPHVIHVMHVNHVILVIHVTLILVVVVSVFIVSQLPDVGLRIAAVVGLYNCTVRIVTVSCALLYALRV